MYRLISYLKFLCSATNQHGVHSPFVYNYVTKCLYKKTKIKLPITLKVLVKSLHYFDYRTIHLLNTSKSSKEKIITNCPNISIVDSNAAIVFGDITDINKPNFKVNDLSNDAMLLLDGIHKNPQNLKKWKQLKEMEHVRVTLDLFYCGIVFFRKEQVKEHFKIRI